MIISNKPQRIVVFGGRSFTDKERMHSVIKILVDQGIFTDPCELICGMAKGADITAYHLFTEYGCITHKYPADWKAYGKSAGYRRNVDMAIEADIGLGFWDGVSKGTKHMIDIMDSKQKPCIVVRY